MTKLPWFQFWGRDFFEDERVKLMSNAQIGMYLKLLQHQWIEGSVPLNIADSSSMDLHHAGHDFELANQELATVLASCFTPTKNGKRLLNARMEKIRREQEETYQLNQSRASKAGQASVLARQLNSSSTQVQHKLNSSSTQAQLKRNSKSTNQKQTQTQTETQKETLNQTETQKDEEVKSTSEGATLPALATSRSADTWEAYRRAYTERYQVEPVRNASVNAILLKFVGAVGQEEAPMIAAFYLQHNEAFYVKKRHPVSLLLHDATGLRTQWATGVKATTGEAKNAEFKDNVVEQVKRIEALRQGERT